MKWDSQRGRLGWSPKSSVRGSKVTFLPLMSCGNNCNNRCSVINQMSRWCAFQKCVPRVQISQNRPCNHPQGRACWVLGSARSGVSSWRVSRCADPRCAGHSLGGAKLLAPPHVSCQQISSSPEHLRDGARGRAGKDTGGGVGRVVCYLF